MYGLKLRAADETTVSLVFVPVPGLAFSFSVEEEEMLCLLSLRALASNSLAGDRCDLDFYVDGVLASGNLNGIAAAEAAVGAAKSWVEAKMVVRLSKGVHKIAAAFKAGIGGTAKLEGATIPLALDVTRLSHNAVLGHGVDAKAQLIQ